MIQAMTLSPEELKQAWVAGEEVKRRDTEQINFPLFSVLGVLWLIIPLGAHYGRAAPYALPLVFLIRGAISGLLYRKLNRRYPANLRLLESLYEREPSLFEYKDSYPTLRMSEEPRRPLLWRVDQFLSRKSTSPEHA
jgi:hypothetical protein